MSASEAGVAEQVKKLSVNDSSNDAVKPNKKENKKSKQQSFRKFLEFRRSKIIRPTSDSKVASILYQQELEIIADLAKAIDSSSTIFFSDLNVTLDTEPERLPPLRFLDDYIEISADKQEPSPICEDLSYYTPSRFTDFFQEEVSQYAAFFQDD